MKKNLKRGGLAMLVGMLLLLGALGLTGYNIWDASRAAKTAESAVEQLRQELPQRYYHVEKPVYTAPQPDEPEEELVLPTLPADGDEYIGVLAVPELGLELPILAVADEEKLKKAPGLDGGSYLTDDMVIAGHNYAKHFSRLKWVPAGTQVLFTTALGEVYCYEVSYLENVRPTNGDYLYTRTDWDLTLYTCTTGGQLRCAVRCVRTDRE